MKNKEINEESKKLKEYELAAPIIMLEALLYTAKTEPELWHYVRHKKGEAMCTITIACEDPTFLYLFGIYVAKHHVTDIL